MTLKAFSAGEPSIAPAATARTAKRYLPGASFSTFGERQPANAPFEAFAFFFLPVGTLVSRHWKLDPATVEEKVNATVAFAPVVFTTCFGPLPNRVFGTGFSAFVGIRYTQEKLGEQHSFSIPGLADIPFLGPALFRQHPMVYLAMALTVGLSWFLYRSRAGLVLRAVGESPESAHALGYPVRRIRLVAVVAGGALCGVAGAYVSVVYTPLWVEGMIAGKGWIALALTTFATWRPARVLLGAWLFGGVTMLQFHLQGEGVQVSSQLLTMLPYLATIVVLVLISRNATWIRAHLPASLGKPFFPGA